MLYLALFTVEHTPVTTPYAERSALALRSIRPARTSVPCYEPLDVDIDLGATYDNPFDPAYVALDAEVTPAKGSVYTVPGYFDRPFSRRIVDGKEVLDPAGPGHWRLRLAATRPGVHRVRVRLHDRSGTASKEFRFTATAAISPGYARISPRDGRYFETSDGKSFFPVGENLCWAGDRGTRDYDVWLPKLGAAGANYGRLWLSPSWTTFGLERPGKPEEGKGMGQFDLGNAWRLEYVLEQAQRRGVRMLLTIDSFNILRDRDGYPEWERAPHNAANGGPLRTMDAFWSDPEMARLYRNKLRYLVARYGAMRSVFAWEFWNEVDVIRDFKPEPVRTWHIAMAKELRKLDPFHHLITTSVGETRGKPPIDLAPGIDFVQSHHYSSPDLGGTVAQTQIDKATWKRAQIFAEIGADVSGDAHAKDDLKGYQAHDPMWASLATGGAGAAQPWFWDSLVEPNGLYPLFTSMARFVKGVDFPGEKFARREPTFAFVREADRGRDDLTVFGQPEAWREDPLHTPQVRVVRGSRFIGGPVSEMLHGVANHRDWHNPLTFQVNLDRPTRLEVEVGRVSGHGGATLLVTVDGQEALKREFVDSDAQKTDDMMDFAGTYGVTIPAGKHAVRVENVGTDWFAASYRFVGIAPSNHPPIDAWAIGGRRTVLGWARVSGRTWPREALRHDAPATAPASTMRLAGLVPGRYAVTLWDTWHGVPIQRFAVTADRQGRVAVPLPIIHEDMAFKLVREAEKKLNAISTFGPFLAGGWVLRGSRIDLP